MLQQFPHFKCFHLLWKHHFFTCLDSKFLSIDVIIISRWQHPFYIIFYCLIRKCFMADQRFACTVIKPLAAASAVVIKIYLLLNLIFSRRHVWGSALTSSRFHHTTSSMSALVGADTFPSLSTTPSTILKIQCGSKFSHTFRGSLKRTRWTPHLLTRAPQLP